MRDSIERCSPQALAAAERWPDEVYAEYGLRPEAITTMRRRLTQWSEEITNTPRE